MEQRKMAMSLAVALAVISMLWSGAMAQSDCTNVLLSMSPCLNYITGNSSSPSSQCCSQLSSVVRSSPRCLCQVLSGGGSSLGLNINQTQALTLPGACNVETPPISSCNNTAASPAESPFGTPTTPTTPSGTESKTVPSTRVDGTSDGSSSDGSSIKLSISLLASLLFAVSYSSIFATL